MSDIMTRLWCGCPFCHRGGLLAASNVSLVGGFGILEYDIRGLVYWGRQARF
jgi:hypothetical protein